jgi:hypothetical protein
MLPPPLFLVNLREFVSNRDIQIRTSSSHQQIEFFFVNLDPIQLENEDEYIYIYIIYNV